MKLNTKAYELELSFKLMNISNYETKYLKALDKGLFENMSDGLTTMNVSTLVNLISCCQMPVKGKNLTVNEIFAFLDDFFVENEETDICEVYLQIIEELRRYGVISKAMGFKLITEYRKAIVEMDETVSEKLQKTE